MPELRRQALTDASGPPVIGAPGRRAAGATRIPGRSALRLEVETMLPPMAFLLLIGASCAVPGAPTDPPQPVPTTEAPPSGSERSAGQEMTPRADTGAENLLDTTRRQLHEATESVVREVDSWFGDRSFEEGGRVAGRIRLGTLWREDEGFDWLTRFSVRVRLPNLEQQAGFLFVGRDNEREIVSDRPQAFTRRELLLQETRDDQSFFAGLGAQVANAIALRAGFRGGLKPYTQARYQKFWDLDDRNLVEFKETLFWTLDDGFGSTTLLVLDHLLSPAHTLRWQTAVTWTQDDPGVQWGSTLGSYRSFGFGRQWSVEALVNGQTGAGVGVAEYGIRTRWEQPVYRDWLLAEVIVGYFWPQAAEFAPRTSTWALGVSLQLLF